MAYPLENEHLDYLDYVERYTIGQEGNGPKMSKEQWRAMKKVKPKSGFQRRPPKETVGSLMEDMGGYGEA